MKKGPSEPRQKLEQAFQLNTLKPMNDFPNLFTPVPKNPVSRGRLKITETHEPIIHTLRDDTPADSHLRYIISIVFLHY